MQYCTMTTKAKRTDDEGKEGKMKAMGLDLKRSDTPVLYKTS